MILQIKIKNLLSYKNEMIFSMIPTSDKELSGNIIGDELTYNGPVLKSAAIYGANASGKTNLIKIINMLKYIIQSGSNMQPGIKLPVMPFKLNTKNLIKPSSIEIIFIKDKIKYIYGIT